MTGQTAQDQHVHRWGHGPSSSRPPDALLTRTERLGIEPPRRWPTPLLCLDCGELWPGAPLPIRNGRRS